MDTLSILKIVTAVLLPAFLAGLLVYLVRKRTADPGKLVFPCILFFGVLYSLIFIPFSAPDEYIHYGASYRLASHLLFTQAVDEEGHVLIREEDDALFGTDLTEENYEEVYGSFFTVDHSEKKVVYGIDTTVMEVAAHAYLPQAVGIALGRLLSLGQVLCIYLGRWMSLLFFAVCVYFAVRLAPFGKLVYFGVAMLPMSLELASSLSYDAFTMGLAMVFTSYALHLAYGAETRVGWRQLVIIGIILGVLAPCKLVYIPLAGLLFLIPREKFASRRRYAAAIVFVVACMAAGILFVESDKLALYFSQSEDSVIWAQESASYTLSYVFAHPGEALSLIVHTVLQQLPTYVNTMFGGRLGWLEYEVSEAFILLLILWTLLAAVPVRGMKESSNASLPFARLRGRIRRKKKAGEKAEGTAEETPAAQKPAGQMQEEGKTEEEASTEGAPAGALPAPEVQVMPASHRIASLVFCLLVAALVMVVMLLFWTPLGSDIVQGVQGRYFLPILPLILLAVRGRSLAWEKDRTAVLMFGYCVIDALVLLSVLWGL